MAVKSNLSLNDFDVTNQEVRDAFLKITKNNIFYNDLQIILEVGLKDKSLFPNMRLPTDTTYIEYLEKWIKGYAESVKNPPSQRMASPKGSCSDPAIQTIVQIATEADAEYVKRMSAYHNLFMSAENIQGNLLEEYISGVIRPYGWIWCNGNVLRAIDFCSSDGAMLLQIKNKSNTENSSSSAIRTGTNIKKWYRLGTQTRNGEKLPSSKWEILNAIINSHVTSGIAPDCHMNEQSYQDFLRSVTLKNKDIISDK